MGKTGLGSGGQLERMAQGLQGFSEVHGDDPYNLQYNSESTFTNIVSIFLPLFAS